KGEDKLVVWTSKSKYYITGFGVDQHFPDDTIKVERYVAGRVYSVCYFDKEQNYYYMKRFQLEPTEKMLSFLDEENMMDFVAITDRAGATLVVTYKGAQASRPADEMDVDSFVGVKSHRAKGKRITTYDVATLTFVEPELPPVEESAEEADAEPMDVEDVDGVDIGDAMELAPADAGDDEAVYEASPLDAEEESAIVIDSAQLNLF
ncbi:MAG: DNA gyrase/topoisomerase IV subunit A, partial [Alistipes sp.]|nr:DNA gyrase/topoisomerase IV subunit A [Alistipes sp.]